MALSPRKVATAVLIRPNLVCSRESKSSVSGELSLTGPDRLDVGHLFLCELCLVGETEMSYLGSVDQILCLCNFTFLLIGHRKGDISSRLWDMVI